MVYKVGVLITHSDQLEDAFTLYRTTDASRHKKCRDFTKIFSMPVTIEFVGAWDTVSTVGVIPRLYLHTSVNYAVKYFRHTLALDERHARFQPKFRREPTLGHEEDLDVDEPNLTPPGNDRNAWFYEPPNRDKFSGFPANTHYISIKCR